MEGFVKITSCLVPNAKSFGIINLKIDILKIQI